MNAFRGVVIGGTLSVLVFWAAAGRAVVVAVVSGQLRNSGAARQGGDVIPQRVLLGPRDGEVLDAADAALDIDDWAQDS